MAPIHATYVWPVDGAKANVSKSDDYFIDQAQEDWHNLIIQSHHISKVYRYAEEYKLLPAYSCSHMNRTICYAETIQEQTSTGPIFLTMRYIGDQNGVSLPDFRKGDFYMRQEYT